MANYSAIFGRNAGFRATPGNNLFCMALTGRSNSLKAQFESGAIDPRRCAHVILDPQQKFVKGKAEKSAAAIDSMADFCRGQGIRNYWFWMPRCSIHSSPSADIQEVLKKPDFYGVSPREDLGDIVWPKFFMSAFTETKLDETLKSENVTTLFLSGYCSLACMLITAGEAAGENYRTIYATDCSDTELMAAYGLLEAKDLYDAGVVFTTSDEIKAGFAARPFLPG